MCVEICCRVASLSPPFLASKGYWVLPGACVQHVQIMWQLDSLHIWALAIVVHRYSLYAETVKRDKEKRHINHEFGLCMVLVLFQLFHGFSNHLIAGASFDTAGTLPGKCCFHRVRTTGLNRRGWRTYALFLCAYELDRYRERYKIYN